MKFNLKKTTNQKSDKTFPIGEIVAMALILLLVVTIANPKILFFLTPEQQQVIVDFQTTYLTQNNPIQSSSGGFDPLRLCAIALLIATCWVINTLVELAQKKIKLQNRHFETIKGLLCNCVKYVVVIFAVIFGLSIMGVNMVAILASLGIIGLIIGFGAQSLIEDVITGLFIVFEGSFHVGDIVVLDGFRGTVSAIGIRTTQVTDTGGNIKIINNSDIRAITNLSDVESMAVCMVSIAYDASIEEAEKVIQKTVERLPQERPDVFPSVPKYLGVDSLGSSSVDLKIVAEVKEQNIYTAKRIMNRELKLAMDEAGIEIPFNQIVVHQADGK